MITLQPHSGAIMLALRYHLNNPEIENFDIRMTKPRSKIYRVVLASKNRSEISFRTGKDYPCYSRVRYTSNGNRFVIGHDHSSVQEEFKIDGRKLYTGDVTTEAGARISFEGEFITVKKLDISESFRLPSGRSVYKNRSYEIDNQW
ncbi:MAG: hypothetical protein GW941_02465 [Candidatus Pacebacteria bacterium]|nr:hypothetical protein [Candidatus Paceibacterota bacterium]